MGRSASTQVAGGCKTHGCTPVCRGCLRRCYGRVSMPSRGVRVGIAMMMFLACSYLAYLNKSTRIDWSSGTGDINSEIAQLQLRQFYSTAVATPAQRTTAPLTSEDITRVQSTITSKVQTTTPSQRNPYAKRKFSWAELTADEIIDTKNCTPVNATLLVYNRVPKCGSSTLQSVLRGLASRNKFQHHSSKIYNQRMLTRHEEETIANDLRKTVITSGHALSFDRHFYYANLTSQGERPAYINMLREPVDRVISLFYYERSPKRWERLTATRPRTDSEIRAAPRIPRDIRRISREGGSKSYYHRLLVASRRRDFERSTWASKNLTQCILEEDRDCVFIPGSIRETTVTFFCGSKPECMVVGSWDALQQAKQNLDNVYSVVGIVEELRLSMVAMERYVPRFLSGMRKVFNALRSEERRRNSTPHPEVSPEIRDALARNLTTDIELYSFAKQRLHQQLEFLGLPNFASEL